MFEDDKSGQNNSYGSYSYGSGYGQQSTSSNGYVNNNYVNNQNSYGGQNSYGYGNGQQTYGTYQYSGNNFGSTPEPPKPPKKKNTAAIVIAAVLILALVVGGIGAGYYAYSRHISLLASSENSQEATKDQTKEEETQTAESSESTETEQSTEKKVETTTTSAATSVVVTDVTEVVEEVMPAMVIIHNNYTASASYFGYTQTQEATASGSGIIVGENDTELLIATNYHVVEGADSLEVIFNDDSSVEAVVKGSDSDMDLAVIAVSIDEVSSDTLDSIKVATLGDSDSLTLGEPAIAIGNALGYGQSVTTGVISAINREVETEEGVTHTFIQTDAAINPGNSGGALLNIQGEVIGINSNKIGGDTVEGMGYAIPISVAKPIIDKLMNEETKRKVSEEDRGYIGISGVSVPSEIHEVYGIPLGVLVHDVYEGGGAADAGIKSGDVIISFDGEEITSMDDLQSRLEYYAKGTTVSITVMRQSDSGYTEVTLDVTLGEAASTSSSTDSNAAGSGDNQYNGQQQPALPDDKNGQNGGNSQQQGGGH